MRCMYAEKFQMQPHKVLNETIEDVMLYLCYNIDKEHITKYIIDEQKQNPI